METPENAALVCDFINTFDLENSTDAFDSPASLARWLQDRGLVIASARATAEDLQRALAVREGLRSALMLHHDPPPDRQVNRVNDLDRSARAFPMRLAFEEGAPVLVGVGDGVSAAIVAILAAVASSGADGTWQRVKVCPADTCRWAFYDGSKNRSRTWCSMRICGNRAKTTSYRIRQRSAATA